MTVRKFCIWLVLVAISSRAGATNEDRAVASALLSLNPGARSNGLGGAYTAVANDATGAYYNPAGIAHIGSFCGGFYYTALICDIYYYYLSGVVRIDSLLNTHIGVLGLSFSRLEFGKQVKVDEYGRPSGYFESYDWALTATWADAVGQHLSLGSSLKFIYSHLTDEATGRTFAIDIGLMYRGIMPMLTLYRPSTKARSLGERVPPGISVGFSLLNIGPKMAYLEATKAQPLLRNVRLGVAYNCIDTDFMSLMFALDLYKPLVNDDPFYKGIFTAWLDEPFSEEVRQVDVRIGCEIGFSCYLLNELALVCIPTLWIGYILDGDGGLSSPTFGFRVLLGPEDKLSCSYIPARSTPLENNQGFSLSLSF